MRKSELLEKADFSRTIARVVTPIQSYAVWLDDSGAKVGEKGFDGCSNLTAVAFSPESWLREIGPFAFRSCGSLTLLYLPRTVNRIDLRAFDEFSPSAPRLGER
jgi:hypothetical protein